VPEIDATTLTPSDLAPMLRAWASGLYPSEAAVGLLIAHGHWLRRNDFLSRLVDAIDDGWGPRGTVLPMAAVDWSGVAELAAQAPASSSELSVLRLAASLAGAADAGSLLEATASLDDTNGRHVLDALAHRFGWHERGTVHVVTGHQDGAPSRHALPCPEPPLPTFDDVRGNAFRLVGQAADCLRSDYQLGTGPTREAALAVQQAFTAIGAAKAALTEAATAQTRDRARRHAAAIDAEARHG
jgi:hypothetical protein